MEEQLYLPSPEIMKRHESPRFKKCADAQGEFEEFMAYRFSLYPRDETYQLMFPHLRELDLEQLSANQLESLGTWFVEAKQKLQNQIWLSNNFDAMEDDARFQALLHWVEWGDVFEMVPEVIF